MSDRLEDGERRSLLALARAAIVDRLRDDSSLARCRESVRITPALQEHRGAFVTLEVADADAPRHAARLRGCIGTLDATEPLHVNVTRNAVHAAFDDPRFTPLREDEYERLRVEISVLGPARTVSGPEAIVVGRDGVRLDHGEHSAVFLQQVAPEQGWAATELLEHLAVKAGLSRDAWKCARLGAFRAEVFGETD